MGLRTFHPMAKYKVFSIVIFVLIGLGICSATRSLFSLGEGGYGSGHGTGGGGGDRKSVV